MAVTVVPAEFHLVLFEAPAIERVAAELTARLGITDDVRIEVDESSPIARCTADPGPPVVVHAESGAFEDLKRPRRLSDLATATSLGRVLLRVRDRRGPFADAPPDAELTLAQSAAWDAYAIGRLGRLGYEVHEPRWRYNFRNRHGFTDAGDRAFDLLWSAESLTWADLAAASDGAIAARLVS